MTLKNKIVSADEAIAIVRDGDTICVSGFVGIGTPDELILALERRFLKEGHPSGLTLTFAAAPGDGKERGLNRLAHKGLLKRVVGGHWSLVPKISELALNNEIEAYNFPLGCISHLYREIAARRSGTISKVGLRTFVDPREQGGKLNGVTTEDLVELLEIGGEEWLRYKAFPINVAFIRGTTCDPNGNLTMEREALTLDNLAAAMAAKNSRGFVIAQVERIAAAESLNPREVQVPGILVDCVVLAEANNHLQTYGTPYNHAFSGRQRVPLDRIEPMELDERKVIARRCAFDLPLGGVVNLGIGMPEGVAAVAAEERILKYLTLTAEPGIVGGVPQGGLDFGLFAGTFTAGGLKIELADGALGIAAEGRAQKFIDRVEQITFSGSYAAETGQPVFYVTERCVFQRTREGMQLIEVAPGIDVERDILRHMKFKPIVKDPCPMNPLIFKPEPMGLEQLLLGLSLAERISYDQERNTIFINFEGFQVRTVADVDLVRREMESRCKAIGRKVALVANYDGFYLDPMVSDAYFSMITYMQNRYYSSASRYTTSAFMRLKLGAALAERNLAPHVFETWTEAQAFSAAQP